MKVPFFILPLPPLPHSRQLTRLESWRVLVWVLVLIYEFLYKEPCTFPQLSFKTAKYQDQELRVFFKYINILILY
jgi:hypothetical protein